MEQSGSTFRACVFEDGRIRYLSPAEVEERRKNNTLLHNRVLMCPWCDCGIHFLGITSMIRHLYIKHFVKLRKIPVQLAQFEAAAIAESNVSASSTVTRVLEQSEPPASTETEECERHSAEQPNQEADMQRLVPDAVPVGSGAVGQENPNSANTSHAPLLTPPSVGHEPTTSQFQDDSEDDNDENWTPVLDPDLSDFPPSPPATPSRQPSSLDFNLVIPDEDFLIFGPVPKVRNIREKTTEQPVRNSVPPLNTTGESEAPLPRIVSVFSLRQQTPADLANVPGVSAGVGQQEIQLADIKIEVDEPDVLNIEDEVTFENSGGTLPQSNSPGPRYQLRSISRKRRFEQREGATDMLNLASDVVVVAEYQSTSTPIRQGRVGKRQTRAQPKTAAAKSRKLPVPRGPPGRPSYLWCPKCKSWACWLLAELREHIRTKHKKVNADLVSWYNGYTFDLPCRGNKLPPPEHLVGAEYNYC